MLRRNVLRGAAVATASSLARVRGASDRVRVALIGSGGRGVEALLPGAVEFGAEVAAACDVYKPNLDRALSAIHSKGGTAAAYTDFRRVLDRKDIDAVLVATPDHWHAPITVAACAAGKDVYVEKPLANDIEGCLKVVEAEARYKRIVQVGVQQRSSQIYFMALRLIREGKIGPVRRCSMVWGADSVGPRREPEPEVPVPDGLDWEAFQGPAPRRPYRASRQRRWRGYWEYGSGAITDFGVHLLDVARWFLETGIPDSSFGAGCHSPGRPPEQVPDMVDLTWKWPGALATYSSRRDEWFNTFWGEGGSLAVNRSLMRIKTPAGAGGRTQSEEVKSPESGQQGTAAHVRNFLECVKSRRKPNADAATGSDSTIACLLAALSVRTGRAYGFDGRAAKAI